MKLIATWKHLRVYGPLFYIIGLVLSKWLVVLTNKQSILCNPFIWLTMEMMYMILLKEYSSMIVLVIIVLQCSLKCFNPKRKSLSMSFYLSIEVYKFIKQCKHFLRNNFNLYSSVSFQINLFYILRFFIFVFLFWSKLSLKCSGKKSLWKFRILETIIFFIVILYVDFRISSLFQHYAGYILKWILCVDKSLLLGGIN